MARLKKSASSKNVSYGRFGYYFTLPFITVYLMFTVFPLVYTVIISFTNLKGLMQFSQARFVGLDNYAWICKTRSFWESIGITLLMWIMNFIPQLVLGMLLAVWFTRPQLQPRGMMFHKTFIYMPNIITAGAVALLFAQLFGHPLGTANDLLKMLGLQSVNFPRNAWAQRIIIAYIYFWMWYGETMLISIAAILGINPSLFEAAQIDGASNTQTFFRVTVPCMRSMILYILVTSIIGGMQNFDIARLLSAGGPNNATRTTLLYIYNQAFSGDNKYYSAAAGSIVLFGVIALESLLVFYIMRERKSRALHLRERG